MFASLRSVVFRVIPNNCTLSSTCLPQTMASIHSRTMASVQSPLVKLSVDEKSGVATLNMCRKPVNSLNLELIAEINKNLESIEKNTDVRALILGSEIPKIFSAGIDINEMYKPNLVRLKKFWSTLQSLWINLYTSRLPVIANICGNSPAGGCLLAMSCDYRVMAEGNFTIGLNETRLGIMAPTWFCDTMVNTIGHRETEIALQTGAMYTGKQALNIGLVDQLAPVEDLPAVCHQHALNWAKVPVSRIDTKKMLRQNTVNKLLRDREADVELFVSSICQESRQQSLKAYLDSLKRPKLSSNSAGGGGDKLAKPKL